MIKSEEIPVAWLELMATLEQLEQLLSSEQEEKWTDAQRLAGQLDMEVKHFFSEYTDLSPSVAAQIAVDGERLLSTLSLMAVNANKQKKEMRKEISGFLNGQKGINAYKKV